MANLNLKYNKVSKSSFKKLLIMKLDLELKGRNKIIFNKSDVISKGFLGYKLYIYKGYSYRSLNINKFVLNYKFGEFAYTRKPFRYMLKSKKK